jgi:hypothetical protein
VDLCPRFLVPFLRSIFAPFLAFVRFAICLFHGTFWISRCLLDPFSDDFLTVHFIALLPTLGLISLPRDYSWIASNKIRGSSALRFVDLLGEITRTPTDASNLSADFGPGF